MVSTTVDDDAEKYSSLASADVPAPDVLAAAVRQRRAELRMSQEDVRRTSGLSVTTIGKIERGDPDDIVQRVTMRRWTLPCAGRSAPASRGTTAAVGSSPSPTCLPTATSGPLLDRLAPLIAERLEARRSRSTINVDGLPPAVVDRVGAAGDRDRRRGSA